MIKKMCDVLLSVLISGFLWQACAAQAQNPMCPTRPLGDNTNACASTAFVQNSFASGLPLPQGNIFIGNASNLATATPGSKMQNFYVTAYGGTCNGSADDTAGIAAAVAAAHTAGGGNVIFPVTTAGTFCTTTATIAITKSNIYLIGQGGGFFQTVATSPGAFITNSSSRIIWTGLAGGTMVSFVSPAGASNPKLSGGGVKGLVIDGDLNGTAVAGTGILIDSWNNGLIEDVQLFEFSSHGIHTATSVTLGDPASVQKWTFDRINCRILSAAGACFQFDGGGGQNTSLNNGNLISTYCNTQDCIIFNDSDNNNLYNLAVFMVGAGNCLVFNDGANTRANSITHYGCNQTTLAKTGTVNNTILMIDADNGTPAPTLQGTATLTYTYNRNLLTQDASGNANLVPGATFAMKGATSGTLTHALQTAAGTPTVTWGTSSGTPAVTASAPLAITAATGNITCATCLTNTPAALTRVDDSNVTITLGGTPSTALLQAVSLTMGWTGDLPFSRFVQGATNTVVANATSGTADFAAFAMPSCSTAASALNWTTNTGFGCNTSITAAAVPVGGITGLGTGVATALAVNVGTAGSFVVNGGALGTPSSGTVTNLTGTASININGTVGATTSTTGVFTTVTASTSVTTPLVIGGTGVSSDLALKATSGVGDGTETVLVQIGNNGATEVGRFYTNGFSLFQNAPALMNGGGIQVGSRMFLQNVIGAQLMFAQNAFYNGSNWKNFITATSQAMRFTNDLDANGNISFHLAASSAADSTLTNWDGTDVKAWIGQDGSMRLPGGVASTSKTTGVLIATGGIGVSGATFTDTLNVITMANTATTSAVCYNTGTGLLTYNATVGTCTVSALSFKDLVGGLEPISGLRNLRTVAWQYKKASGFDDGKVHVGLLADDVAKMDHRCAVYNDKGKLVNYEDRCVLAYLKADNDNIRAELEILKRRISK